MDIEDAARAEPRGFFENLPSGHRILVNENPDECCSCEMKS
jgi:hypothetical protein